MNLVAGVIGKGVVKAFLAKGAAAVVVPTRCDFSFRCPYNGISQRRG